MRKKGKQIIDKDRLLWELFKKYVTFVLTVKVMATPLHKR